MLKQENKPEVIDSNEKYRIYSKNGILSVLRLMIRNNSLATCYVGQSGRFFLTTVLSLDTQRNELVLDYGPDDVVNQRALKTNNLSIVAFPNKVKIEFVCPRIEKTQFEGRNAFLAQIPESLLHIQKREYYRIATPTVAPVKCAIPLPEGELRPTVVVLQNISCGGMAVVDYECRVSFQKKAIYRNCLIRLPGVGTVKVNIRIQRVEIQQADSLKRQRVSCEYVDTEEIMLSMIQRYINKLELEKKRKL